MDRRSLARQRQMGTALSLGLLSALPSPSPPPRPPTPGATPPPYPWPDTPGHYAARPALRDHYAMLAHVRHQYPALRTGSFDTLLTDDARALYAYGRKLDGDSLPYTWRNCSPSRRLDVFSTRNRASNSPSELKAHSTGNLREGS